MCTCLDFLRRNTNIKSWIHYFQESSERLINLCVDHGNIHLSNYILKKLKKDICKETSNRCPINKLEKVQINSYKKDIKLYIHV